MHKEAKKRQKKKEEICLVSQKEMNKHKLDQSLNKQYLQSKDEDRMKKFRPTVVDFSSK